MTKPANDANRPRIIGFCWFRRESYQDARSLMADPDVLFDTFDEWLVAARQIERDVTEKGDKVVRIRFDAASFMLWCASHGRMPDEQARAAWAAAEARKKFGTRG